MRLIIKFIVSILIRLTGANFPVEERPLPSRSHEEIEQGHLEVRRMLDEKATLKHLALPKNFSDIQTNLATVLNKTSGEAQSLLRKAESAITRGQLDEAIQLLHQSIDLQSDDHTFVELIQSVINLIDIDIQRREKIRNTYQEIENESQLKKDLSNKGAELKAIYYPFSRCLDEETLKRALLLYDHLIFVDPKTPKVRRGLYSIENHQAYLPNNAAEKLAQEWEDIEKHYDLLQQEKVISFFDPSKLLEHPTIDRLISENLQVDMHEPQIFKLFESNSPQTWSILRSRIPKTAFTYLHHQYTERVLDYADSPFGNSTDEAYALFSDGKPDQNFSLPGDNATLPEVKEEYACVVPYYLGSSLSVSLALAISSDTDALLFTDSDAHHKLLSIRFQRAAFVREGASFGDIPGLKPQAQPGVAQKRRLVELRLMDTILSPEDLKAMTLEGCLEYRERTKKARENFRGLLSDVTNRIQHAPWSPEVEQEIRGEIEKVQVAIEAQKTSLLHAYQDLFRKTAVGVTIGVAPVLLNTIFPEISTATAFILGAGVTSGLLAEPIKDLISLWSGSLGNRNSLAYLLNLKRKGT